MYIEHEFSRRWWFALVPVLLLAIFGLLAVSIQRSAAQVSEAGQQVPDDPGQALSTLEFDVNYASDWVAGVSDAWATVVVTVTDHLDTVKDDAVVTADETGDFFVGCDDWFSGWCPDIVPGDHVSVMADGETGVIDPIGAIVIDSLDASTQEVAGTLHADWFEGPLEVRCEIWEEMGPVVIVPQVDPDGGSFTCDFFSVGWDLQRGQTVAVRYWEPDGDSVITLATWPSMRVNLGHDSVGGDYPAGHTLVITATDDLDSVKGTASAISEWSGGWDGEGFVTEEDDWSPAMPDIVPGDIFYIAANNGYTHTVEAGTIQATVDTANDRITGQIWASFGVTLTVECHPWGAWEAGIDAPVKESWAEPDGSEEFTCQWDPATEWDMQPGQEIAVMYIEPDYDRVIDVFEEPAPYLRVEKQGFGELTQGGNARYQIELWNEGSASAENVVLTDIMEGLAYLEDTSGYLRTGEGSGPIVWQAGTLGPGQSIQFDLFVQVTASISEVVTNTISVATTTGFDQGEPWEKTATWVAQIKPNDTYLHVGKSAWTENPAPDQDVVFVLEVCNEGSTGSSTVTLSDELDPPLSLEDWWSYEAGWTELSSGSDHLVVTRPAIDGGACSTVYLRAHVVSTAEVGHPLVNTALIDADNDLSPDDNEAIWESQVDEPQKNVRISKGWSRGQLVPGGEIRYYLHYENTGNVPAGPLILTDTLPINTTFVGAWHQDPWGMYPFVPIFVNGEIVVWEIPGLPNGASGEVEVALAIDAAAEPGTVLVNGAEISRLPEEIRYDDNESEWTEIIYSLLPNLRIHKFHEWGEGWQLLYEVQFENIGSEPVDDVLITDVLPPDTYLDGSPKVEFDPERLVDWDYDEGSRTLLWNFSELLPGESGWIQFSTNLGEPDTPFRWYTNTVEITLPDGDPSPADNYAETVAFRSGWHYYLPLVFQDD